MLEAPRSCERRPGRFIYYMHDGSAGFRFRLTGDLSEANTAELDQARVTASSILNGRSLIVDLTDLDSMDRAARQLIAQWHGLGAQLVVATQEAKARIGSMTGMPIGLLENTRSPKWFGGSTPLLAAAAVLVIILMLMGQAR